jgi:hypothetical protein
MPRSRMPGHSDACVSASESKWRDHQERPSQTSARWPFGGASAVKPDYHPWSYPRILTELNYTTSHCGVVAKCDRALRACCSFAGRLHHKKPHRAALDEVFRSGTERVIGYVWAVRYGNRFLQVNRQENRKAPAKGKVAVCGWH